MDLKDQIIQEYLNTGCGYRKLALKYGISRTIICRWVLVYQQVHNLPLTDLQQKHYFSPMEVEKKAVETKHSKKEHALLQKIAALEKQVKHNQMKAEVLDTLINTAERELKINIRKKSGTQQSSR